MVVQGQVSCWVQGDKMGRRPPTVSVSHVSTTDVVSGAQFPFPALLGCRFPYQP